MSGSSSEVNLSHSSTKLAQSLSDSSTVKRIDRHGDSHHQSMVSQNAVTFLNFGDVERCIIVVERPTTMRDNEERYLFHSAPRQTVKTLRLISPYHHTTWAAETSSSLRRRIHPSEREDAPGYTGGWSRIL